MHIPSCSAVNCGNDHSLLDCTRRGVSFHRFPKDPERRKKWLIAIGRGKKEKSLVLWEPTSNCRLCSEHFLESDFVVKHLRKYLKPDAVPSVFNHRRQPKDRLLVKKLSIREDSREMEECQGQIQLYAKTPRPRKRQNKSLLSRKKFQTPPFVRRSPQPGPESDATGRPREWDNQESLDFMWNYPGATEYMDCKNENPIAMTTPAVPVNERHKCHEQMEILHWKLKSVRARLLRIDQALADERGAIGYLQKLLREKERCQS